MSDELEVARFASLPEAEAVAALLRTHGIAARLADSHTASAISHMSIALGGARIVVPDHQVYAARELVLRARAGEFASDFGAAEEADADTDDSSAAPSGMLGLMRAWAPFIIAAFFLLPVASCLMLSLAHR